MYGDGSRQAFRTEEGGQDLKIDVLQIGANEGNTTTDHVWKKIVDGTFKTGWLIEPNPDCIPKLTACYKDYPGIKIANVAISDKAGVVTLHRPIGFDSGWSSLWQTHLFFQNRMGPDCVSPVEVPATTLNQFCQERGISEVGWLHIDTEGHDCTILRSTDFSKLKVRNIQFEHTHSDGTCLVGENYRQTLAYMAGFGYRVAEQLNEDTILTLA